MKAAVRQRAREIGFDDCRFTSANPPDTAGRLHDWLAQQYHGGMEWLQRNAEKRADPQKVLPGAKSVICLALSYDSENWKSKIGNQKFGVVARYARVDDYHDVL